MLKVSVECLLVGKIDVVGLIMNKRGWSVGDGRFYTGIL